MVRVLEKIRAQLQPNENLRHLIASKSLVPATYAISKLIKGKKMSANLMLAIPRAIDIFAILKNYPETAKYAVPIEQLLVKIEKNELIDLNQAKQTQQNLVDLNFLFTNENSLEEYVINFHERVMLCRNYSKCRALADQRKMPDK